MEYSTDGPTYSVPRSIACTIRDPEYDVPRSMEYVARGTVYSHPRSMEFTTNGPEYNVSQFYDKFRDKLPELVMVTQGYSGRAANDTFVRGQVLRLQGVSKQTRVMARSVIDGKQQWLSLPLTYPGKLCVVKEDGNVSPEMSLSHIVQTCNLPVDTQFPSHQTVSVNCQTFCTQSISTLQLIETFEETNFLGNVCSEGGLDEPVISVPLYLTDLRLAEVTGAKGYTLRQWYKFKDDLDVKSNYMEFDEEFGRLEIAIYDPDMSYMAYYNNYMEPTEYASFNIQHNRKANIEQVGNLDGQRDRPPTVLPKRKREHSITEDTANHQQDAISQSRTCKPALPVVECSVDHEGQQYATIENTKIDESPVGENESQSNTTMPHVVNCRANPTIDKQHYGMGDIDNDSQNCKEELRVANDRQDDTSPFGDTEDDLSSHYETLYCHTPKPDIQYSAKENKLERNSKPESRKLEFSTGNKSLERDSNRKVHIEQAMNAQEQPDRPPPILPRRPRKQSTSGNVAVATAPGGTIESKPSNSVSPVANNMANAKEDESYATIEDTSVGHTSNGNNKSKPRDIVGLNSRANKQLSVTENTPSRHSSASSPICKSEITSVNGVTCIVSLSDSTVTDDIAHYETLHCSSPKTNRHRSVTGNKPYSRFASSQIHKPAVAIISDIPVYGDTEIDVSSHYETLHCSTPKPNRRYSTTSNKVIQRYESQTTKPDRVAVIDRARPEVVSSFGNTESDESSGYATLYSNDIPRSVVTPTLNLQAGNTHQQSPETPKRSTKTVEKRISKETVDVGNLSIADLGDYLVRLKLEKYVEDFQKQMIDGSMLCQLNKEILREDLGFSNIEALRLAKFADTGNVPT